MTTKEALLNSVQSLTEEEARLILEFIQLLQRGQKRARPINPAYKLPPPGKKTFRKARPMKATGIPASELLSQDRR
jgi:hypothetical protein